MWFVVVSWPANSSRMQVATSSSSVRRSPSSSRRCTSSLIRSARGVRRRSSISSRKKPAISCVAASAVSYFSGEVRDEPMNSAMSSLMRLTRASSERSTPSRAMITRQGSGPAKSVMKSNSVRAPMPSISQAAMSST